MIIKPAKLDIDYDSRDDALYISLGNPRVADESIEPQDGVVFRSRKGELIGITIIGLNKKLHTSAGERQETS